MKCIIKVANLALMLCSKSTLKEVLGTEKYRLFRKKTTYYKKKYYPEIPEIGKTVFDTSYYFASCYFFYFPALKDLGYSAKEAGTIIWKINESFLRKIPRLFLAFTGNFYVSRSKKMGIWATEQAKRNNLHPYDWRIEYKEISKQKWSIDIMECYVIKMAKRFNQMDMFPYICRMDYLFSHYFKQGFERTKTLGDGNDCCNCQWEIPGKCDWPVTDPKLK